MNYLLYGTESFLIEQELKKIINKYKIDDISTTKYDLSIDSLKNILDDSMTVSLFDENKLIVVNNANIFNRGKNDDNIDLLVQYLSNPNPSTIIVFINPNATVDSTKKITKLIKDKGVIKELNTTNPTDIIKSICGSYKIDRECINLLIDRVGSNVLIIEQELNKLMLYKIDDKIITKEDIINLTSVNIDTDIFKFIDYIIQKEKDMAMRIYNEMIKQGEEPIKIIALLASKFRLMYQAVELTRSGCSQQDISSTLGVHIYPVKLAIQAGLKYNNKLLLNYLDKLADLDISIKTGKVEPVLGLELFILDV